MQQETEFTPANHLQHVSAHCHIQAANAFISADASAVSTTKEILTVYATCTACLAADATIHPTADAATCSTANATAHSTVNAATPT